MSLTEKRKEEQIWGEELKFRFRLPKFEMSLRHPSTDVEKAVGCIPQVKGTYPGWRNKYGSRQHMGGILKHKIS